MKIIKNNKVQKTLDFDFENISSEMEEAPANFHSFLDILSNNHNLPQTSYLETPHLPRLSKDSHLIEAAPCFNADEYHNSNIERNFGNQLLNELNDNLSDFSLAEISNQNHEESTGHFTR